MKHRGEGEIAQIIGVGQEEEAQTHEPGVAWGP